MKKRYLLGLAISGFLLYLLFRSLELAAVVRAFGDADLAFLAPALLLYFAGVIVRTVRWAVLLRPLHRLGLRRLFVVMVVGFMANDILPLRAGEGVRAFMLWKEARLEPGATLATIVVERVFDGLALASFLLVAGLIVALNEWLARLALVAGVIFVVGIGFVFALTVAPRPILGLARSVLSPLPLRLRDAVLRIAVTFVDGLATLRSPRDIGLVALLSLAAWLLEAGMYYLLMFSFPFPPSYVASILGTAVANLASMVPASPGYVGTFDFALVALLSGSFGVDPSFAAAYTGLVHAALIIPVTLLGLFFAWREGFSLRRASWRSTEDGPGCHDPADRAEVVPGSWAS